MDDGMEFARVFRLCYNTFHAFSLHAGKSMILSLTRKTKMKNICPRMMCLAAAALLAVWLPAGMAGAEDAQNISYQPADFDTAQGRITSIDQIGMQFFLTQDLTPVAEDDSRLTVGKYASADHETTLEVTRMPAVTGTGENIRTLDELERMYRELGASNVRRVRINGLPALLYNREHPTPTMAIVFLKKQSIIEFSLCAHEAERQMRDYAPLLIQSITLTPSPSATGSSVDAATPSNLP